MDGWMREIERGGREGWGKRLEEDREGEWMGGGSARDGDGWMIGWIG